jgi:hypothetical protein
MVLTLEGASSQKRSASKISMYKGLRLGVTTAAIVMAVLMTAAPAHAGNGSAIGAGLVGFGIGAVLGSMLTPPDVYYVPPPPPDYYDYYGYDGYGPVDYGPDYGPPPPPRPHRHVTAPAPRDANDPHAVGTPATKPAKASLSAAQKADAKFKAIQAKAKREGVENLTREDIDGLSYAQLKQLRGY